MNRFNKLKPIIDPIIVSTNFAQIEPCQDGYSRVDNPTRLLLERELARLEKAKFALAFSSGSAASGTVLSSFQCGDHIICSEEIYEGTLRLVEKVFNKFGLSFTLVNLANLIDVEKSIKENTRLIWMENVTNPTLKVYDVKKICDIAHKKNTQLLVDNTFSTPIFQNPLLDGADIVLHSLTKFIGGHHDVTAGAIMLNDKKLFKKLKFLQQTIGVVPSPFDCFLIGRGIKSLEIRMKRHTENAKKIASFLRLNRKIEKVSFPGFSGVVSFWLRGDRKKTLQFLRRLRIIKIAHSFGGTESTILYPVLMMTLSMPKEKRKKIGITDNLVRLSVGLEDSASLIRDLERALK